MNPLSPSRAQAEDPIVVSPFAIITNLNISVLVLVWHLAASVWNLINYVAWIRFNTDLIGNAPPHLLYLAFVVISLIISCLAVSPMLLYAGKYLQGSKLKNKWLANGILLAFIGSDLPLFFLDWSITYHHPDVHVLPFITFAVRAISFFCNGLAAWLILLHRGSKWLFVTFRSQDDLRQLALLRQKNAQRARDGITVEYPKSALTAKDFD